MPEWAKEKELWKTRKLKIPPSSVLPKEAWTIQLPYEEQLIEARAILRNLEWYRRRAERQDAHLQVSAVSR